MMFGKATASCIVVILFHVGFELILLCDLMGRATLNVTMMLFVPKMVRKHPLTRPCIHSLVSAQATKKFLVPMRHTIQGNTF